MLGDTPLTGFSYRYDRLLTGNLGMTAEARASLTITFYHPPGNLLSR